MSRSPRLRACFGPGLSILAPAAILLAALASDVAAQTDADEFAIGKAEYLSACSACHGDAADGNGPIASMFRGPVPDLTGLAQRNEGAFPFLKVFQIIDGRSVVRAHGDPMPVFGGRFRAEAEAGGTIFGSEAIARGRLLELVLYLQSIQN
jgi:mono/diheme cytochrome c family protein